MLDLHTHVLPGVDDGPRTLADSVALLRAAHEDGVERMAATPHVRDDYPTSAGEMERLVADVNAAARAEGIPVEVLPGGEIDLGYLRALDDDDLRRFGLGGNHELLLLEFPYLGWPLGLPDIVRKLQERGFRIVLAHPERNLEVQQQPGRLVPLVGSGVLVQLTAASVDGRLGRSPQRCARELLNTGLAHLLASDAHAPAVRAIGLTSACDALRDRALARWLTAGVPAALLAGERLPPRPTGRPRRRLPRPWRT